MTALVLAALTAGYDGGTALHGVDLEIPAGSVHAVLGHNGAGKTTLVHAVAGLVTPTGGQVLLEGRAITRLAPHRRARAGIGLVPQGRRVFPDLSVDEHLALAFHRSRRNRSAAWTPARIKELLPRLAERSRHRGRQLSGGEQQMLAIARALLGQPRVLLLDEPGEGLAPLVVGTISTLIRRLADDGLAVLVTAPQQGFATALADRTTVLSAGRVVDELGDFGAREQIRVREGRTLMRGGRVAVVGGSIAGCGAALAAARRGADEVVVFERAAEDLRDRGVGLTIQNDRYAELAAAGFVDDDMPFVQLRQRLWLVRDDSEGADPKGRAIAIQPFPFRSYNWGPLWRELRARIPESVQYRTNATVASVKDGADGAVVTLADGTMESFDLVIGADGYRSVTRSAFTDDAVPEFAGYLGWRATLPTERLAELSDLLEPGREWQHQDSLTFGFDGGHMVGYAIPGTDGADDVLNLVLYCAVPAGVDLELTTPTSLPPGKVADALIDHLDTLAAAALPPYWAAAIRLIPRDQKFIQPIYDCAAPSYAGQRIVLLGDAAVVARPHLGAGAVKALQDVAALERIWSEAESWRDLLDRYDAERRAVGHQMMVIGRRIGRAQVTDTPDWGAFDQAGLEGWYRELTAAPDGSEALGGQALKR